MFRRTLAIGAGVGIAGGVWGPVAKAAALTPSTAGEAIVGDILRRRLRRVDEGAAGPDDALWAVHRNFAQIIEQNFAERDARSLARLVDALSAAELSDLAQLYVTAVADSGRPPLLFAVLAHRLDAGRLASLSRHFGFASLYAAANAVAPAKLQDFIAGANVNDMGPAVGEMRFGPAGRCAPSSAGSRRPAAGTMDYTGAFRLKVAARAGEWRRQRVGFGQFMHLTPYEIFLDFRTAPIGALGVAGALWETSVVLSSTLTVAYGTGYAIGTHVVVPLMQNYAPDLYDAIGSTIAGMVDSMTNSWSSSVQNQSAVQQSTAIDYQSLNSQISGFSAGGDFGVSASWAMCPAPGSPIDDRNPKKKPN